MNCAVTEGNVLTPAGVATLRSDRSVAARQTVAASVAKAVSAGNLQQSEMDIALQIVERLAEDLAVEVRSSLAEHIKEAIYLPRELAIRLAQDVEAVALPIIRCSEVLKDSDLIAIVESGNCAKQTAVASRRRVSETVSRALVATGEREPARHLLANKGAQIGEDSYEKLASRYHGDREFEELLVARDLLPPKVLAQLVSSVSQHLRTALLHRHDLPANLVYQLTDQGEAKALLERAIKLPSNAHLSLFLEQSRQSGSLTAHFLMRALCGGEIDIFAMALATAAGIPASCARVLMHDEGTGGLQGLCRKAGIDDTIWPLLRAALRTVLEIKDQTESPWQEGDTDRVLRSVVEASENIGPGNLESVMSQIGLGEVMRSMSGMKLAQAVA